MKVLVFAPQYLPIVGGIEILIDTLARQFRKQSLETVVVTDRPGDLPAREWWTALRSIGSNFRE